jgi:hypothetical protein
VILACSWHCLSSIFNAADHLSKGLFRIQSSGVHYSRIGSANWRLLLGIAMVTMFLWCLRRADEIGLGIGVFYVFLHAAVDYRFRVWRGQPGLSSPCLRHACIRGEPDWGTNSAGLGSNRRSAGRRFRTMSGLFRTLSSCYSWIVANGLKTFGI